ncbi:MAG: ribonuclease HII [Bacteroidia bacterium]|nr:ribonuclease HII [Bacteroidia bacterium]MDW8134062.1 ribonuclease HII [Bacteroidia bacterium]
MKVAGVDEAGRGALAGPVVAAAVILPSPQFSHPLLRDSKTLSPKQREKIFSILLKESIAIGIGMQGPQVIDTCNILQATLLAMEEAIETLHIMPEQIRVDGPHLPRTTGRVEACIHGDKMYPEIAAASIIAKVVRDRLMNVLHILHPVYGWAENKGYGTPAHWEALDKWGISTLHRLSFVSRRLKKGPY